MLEMRGRRQKNERERKLSTASWSPKVAVRNDGPTAKRQRKRAGDAKIIGNYKHTEDNTPTTSEPIPKAGHGQLQCFHFKTIASILPVEFQNLIEYFTENRRGSCVQPTRILEVE